MHVCIDNPLMQKVCRQWVQVRPDASSTNKYLIVLTHRRSWEPTLSRGAWSTHGNIPVERTNSSAGSFHRVSKGGHLLQDHFFTNLNHMFSRKSWTLGGKSFSYSSVEVTKLCGKAETMAASLRNLANNSSENGRKCVLDSKCVANVWTS